MNGLYVYLKTLSFGKALLWCYMTWYLVMLYFHFDPAPVLWLNALGISLIIGTGLVISVIPKNGGIKAMDRWQIMRLFLMPFAVSSFSAMIKGQSFILVFSPTMRENAIALGVCLAFMLIRYLIRKTGTLSP